MARPPKEINWAEVEKRMEAGNNARQISAACRVDTDTFYRRFKEEFGCSFGDYSAEAVQCGEANIAFMQYMQAMKGNNHMLTLLGKERLGQGKEDKDDKNVTIKIIDARSNNSQEIQMPALSG